MGVLIDRENMTDAEFNEYIYKKQGETISQQRIENASLRQELQRLTDAIQGAKLSNKKSRRDYLPRPAGKIGAGTPKDWSHALIDKIFEARTLSDEALEIDGSSKALLEGKIFVREASEFKSWALSVAEIIALGISWLDSEGVNEVARCHLFKEINDRSDS